MAPKIIPAGGTTSASAGQDIAFAILSRICTEEAFIPTDGGSELYLRYPMQMPSEWLDFSEEVYSSAVASGWKVVDINDTRFIVPPDEVLSEVISPFDYNALISAKIARKRVLPETLTPSTSHVDDVFNQIENLCLDSVPVNDGSGRNLFFAEGFAFFYLVEEISVIESVSMAIGDGWSLVDIEGNLYILPPEGIVAASGELDRISAEGLRKLRQIGAIGLRGGPKAPWWVKKDEAKATDPNIVPGVKNAAAGQLDIDAFQLRQWDRWASTDGVVRPVVDLSQYTWLNYYPELAEWLGSHLAYVEPLDMVRLQNFIEAAESSSSTEAIEGIFKGIQGVLGEISVRPRIVERYREAWRVEPNAVLMVAPQICSVETSEASDAVIGVIITAGERPAMSLISVLEITTSDSQVPSTERQMEHTLVDRYPNGCHLRDSDGKGITLDVTVAERPAVAGIVPVEMDADTAGVLEHTRLRVSTRFSQLELRRSRRVKKAFRYRTDDELISELRAFAKRLGRTPTNTEVDDAPDMASSETYRQHFDSFNAAVEMAGLVPRQQGDSLAKPVRTREQMIADLQRLAKELGHSPTNREVRKRAATVGDIASANTYRDEFVKFSKALKAAGLKPRKHGERVGEPIKTDAQLEADLKRLAKKLGRAPKYDELGPQNGTATAPTYAKRKRFGSFVKALKANDLTPHRVDKTRAEMIKDLQDLAAKLGRSPTQPEVNDADGFASASAYVDEFVRFNNALKEAGLEQRRPSDTAASPIRSNEQLITELQALGRKLGRTPRPADVDRTEGMVDSQTYTNRFDSFDEALEEAGLETKGSSSKQDAGFATVELLAWPVIGPAGLAAKAYRAIPKPAQTTLRGGFVFLLGDIGSELARGNWDYFRELSVGGVAADYAALSVGDGIGNLGVKQFFSNPAIARVTPNVLKNIAGRAIPLFSALAVLEYTKNGKIDWERLPIGMGNVLTASTTVQGAVTLFGKSRGFRRAGEALRVVTTAGKATLVGAVAMSVAEFTIIKLMGDIENSVIEARQMDAIKSGLAGALVRHQHLMERLRSGEDITMREILEVEGEFASYKYEIDGLLQTEGKAIKKGFEAEKEHMEDLYQKKITSTTNCHPSPMPEWVMEKRKDAQLAQLEKEENKTRAAITERQRKAIAFYPLPTNLEELPSYELLPDGEPPLWDTDKKEYYGSILAGDWPSLSAQLARYIDGTNKELAQNNLFFN